MDRNSAARAALAAALCLAPALALAQKKPAPPSALVILAPDATEGGEGTAKAVLEALKAHAATLKDARVDDGSFSVLSLLEACPTVEKECIKRVAAAVGADRLVRTAVAMSGKENVKVSAFLHEGATGEEVKRAERTAALAKAAEAARGALEEALKVPETRGVKAVAATDPAPKAKEAGPAPMAKESSSPAKAIEQAASGSRSMFRMAGALAIGRAVESNAPEGEVFAQGELGLYFTSVQDLLLGVELHQQIYDRRYRTRLPSPVGAGGLWVDVHERAMLARLLVGYNVLSFAVDGERAGLSPFFDVRPGRHDNDLAPQTWLGVGGGLSGHARVSESVRLWGEGTYSHYDLPLFKEQKESADALLESGHVQAAVRYSFGVEVAFPPSWWLGVAYRGEWLRQTGASRFSDGLALTMSVDL